MTPRISPRSATTTPTSPPSKRCNFCFGPAPCEDHPNIVTLNCVTSHNIDAVNRLAEAHNADLELVVITGLQKDGREYFASSVSDAAEAMYYLQRALFKLNRLVDDEDDEP